jgi:hypothetical protein
MQKELTNTELFEAIIAFSDNVDKRFEHIEDELKKDIGTIRSEMATKDYVDRKFSEFRGDMCAMMKRGVQDHEMHLHNV